MKQVLLLMFFVTGLATTELSAQSCCTPAPSCCTPNPACCATKSTAANGTAATTCTPEQMKQCAPGQSKACAKSESGQSQSTPVKSATGSSKLVANKQD